MLDERYTVLSALIDREVVDPDALAIALEDPDGRARLVDFVRLRLELQREDAESGNVETSGSTRRRRSALSLVATRGGRVAPARRRHRQRVVGR